MWPELLKANQGELTISGRTFDQHVWCHKQTLTVIHPYWCYFLLTYKHHKAYALLCVHQCVHAGSHTERRSAADKDALLGCVSSSQCNVGSVCLRSNYQVVKSHVRHVACQSLATCTVEAIQHGTVKTVFSKCPIAWLHYVNCIYMHALTDCVTKAFQMHTSIDISITWL